MSLRIQSNPPGLDSAAAARSEKSGLAANPNGTAALNGQDSGPDRVVISPAAESLTSALSSANRTQLERVRQLGALYASGQYNVQPAAVSRALVSFAIGERVADS